MSDGHTASLLMALCMIGTCLGARGRQGSVQQGQGVQEPVA